MGRQTDRNCFLPSSYNILHVLNQGGSGTYPRNIEHEEWMHPEWGCEYIAEQKSSRFNVPFTSGKKSIIMFYFTCKMSCSFSF